MERFPHTFIRSQHQQLPETVNKKMIKRLLDMGMVIDIDIDIGLGLGLGIDIDIDTDIDIAINMENPHDRVQTL